MTMGQLGPIQRRLLAEDLVRLRRPDEQRRDAACQRQGRIDPNPRQIDQLSIKQEATRPMRPPASPLARN
jgi:hypothetical protein